MSNRWWRILIAVVTLLIIMGFVLVAGSVVLAIVWLAS